jgi:hypothetical protein
MRLLPLSDFGLETVQEVSQRKGWSPKTIQNWIAAELLPAVMVGSGRSTFLLRTIDVDAFTPPPRGRPPLQKKTTKRSKK